MRYPASEKLEIIRLVEESHLSARLTLAKLGIPRTTFYRWYDRYLQRGEAGLQDQSPKPKHVWNRIPDEVRRKVVKLALKETELSPRELAVTFTDKESYFVSEASTYRILKAHDLITSPAFIVIKAANEFKDKTTAINQLWQPYCNNVWKYGATTISARLMWSPANQSLCCKSRSIRLMVLQYTPTALRTSGASSPISNKRFWRSRRGASTTLSSKAKAASRSIESSRGRIASGHCNAPHEGCSLLSTCFIQSRICARKCGATGRRGTSG